MKVVAAILLILLFVFFVITVVHRILTGFQWYRRWFGGRWYFVVRIYNPNRLRWVMFPDNGAMGSEDILETENHKKGAIVRWNQKGRTLNE